MRLKFINNAFSGGILSPEIHGRKDYTKTPIGLADAENMVVEPTGAISNTAGTLFLNATKDKTKNSYLLEFTFNRHQAYAMEFGENYIRFYRDKALLVTGGSTPVEVVTTYAAADIPEIRYTQDKNKFYLTHEDYPPRVLTRISDTSWTIADMVFQPTVEQPASFSLAKTGTPVISFDWVYTVSSVNKNSEESMPLANQSITADIELLDTPITVTITKAVDESDIKHYRVYRKKGIYLYLVGIVDADGSATYDFKDTGLTADETESVTEPFTEFGSAGNYPRAVGFYNQRLWLGGTTNDPNIIWGSRIKQYENFTNTPLLNANEAIKKELNSGEVNKISHFTTKDDLLACTDGRIWRIKGTSNDDLVAYIESDIGASDVRPITTRKSMLFLESNETTISDFVYEHTVGGYDGERLDTLVRTLFDGYTITDIAYQDSPHGVIYALRSDGVLLAMTYLKKQNIYAWTKGIVPDGEIESICALNKSQADEVYLVVKRNIDGTDERYVEVMQSQLSNLEDVENSWYVHSGLQYSGAATTTITGLDHLEGEKVVALCNGDVIDDLTVISGAVTLPREYTLVTVGLPVTSYIETINIDLDIKGGTTVGMARKITEIVLSIFRTRGIWTGEKGKDVTERRSTAAGDIGVEIPVESDKIKAPIEGSHAKEKSIRVEHRAPLPFKLLNITYDMDFGK